MTELSGDQAREKTCCVEKQRSHLDSLDQAGRTRGKQQARGSSERPSEMKWLCR